MKLTSALSALICLVPLATWAGPVDINTADATTLAKELKGVGPARAQAIIAYRTQNGPFKSPDDLALVKSIPQKVVDENRENIQVEGSRTAQAAGRSTAKPVKASRSPP
jgi:competence protein ComEA